MRSRNRWLALFVVARALATGIGVTLVLVHDVSDHDGALAIAASVYGVGSILAAVRWGRLHRSPLAWSVDAAVVLGLVLAATQWRSPFYLLALTALVFPSTTLPFRRALGFGLLFTAGYLAVAAATGVDWDRLDKTARLESLATHLMMPMLVASALAYATLILRRLREERERSERLAIEAERRRIAWELHDSAKQRVHAAHLVLSALRARGGDGADETAIDQAMTELQAAATDMDTSLSELRTPLQGRRLGESLRERANELSSASGVRIEVEGDAPALPTFVAAHAFRVVGEAMTNAVRHAEAERVDVRLRGVDSRLTAEVSDDGRGMGDSSRRPGSTGLRSMQERARMLGGDLTIAPGDRERGTLVKLDVPLDPLGVGP